ncbi:substrate-binding domain-containing protein [Enterobacter sp. ECC-175]|uniref:substrate-binding domain-containing protein n=1 Tax=unclassified Enterobacter TaxID=2608935 RepID=UPI000D4D1D65|nr:substrate-binding domain-containing protein [Enterobacter sp. RIT 418]RAU36985.1 ABC transporter substrate-binding protein [Enterobacter sp. RIT 418]
MMTFYRSCIAALIALSASTAAVAQDVTVMISGGFRAALEKLAPAYEAQSGDRIVLVSGPSMGKTPQAIPNRLARGEHADVTIMVGSALEQLERDRLVAAGSRVELADSPIGVVVKKGAPVPSIGTDAELRQTLLAASTIAYSDSASGRYVETQLFKKLGIVQQAGAKAQKVERIPVAEEVAKGKYALGFQQVSELLPVPGVTFVGRLPDNLQYITRFAGAVTQRADHPARAKALLAYLSSAQAQAVIISTGLQPVRAQRP